MIGRGRRSRFLVSVCGLQAGSALVYLLATDAGLAAPTTLAVPFVWLTTAATAVRVVDTPSVSRRVGVVAAVVGAGYTLGLAWLTGLVSVSTGDAAGLHLFTLPPGWGPAVGWDGSFVAARLLPYRVAGYLAVGYLVAVAAAETLAGHESNGTGVCSAAGGAVAVASCAGCSLPVVASLGAGLGSAGLAVGGLGLSTYLLATASYLLAVAALVWRRRLARWLDGLLARTSPS